jgi:transposase
MSDHRGARLVLDALLPAQTPIADRDYDSNTFREALTEKGIAPCIPSSHSRKAPISHDKALYRQRHKIQNMFARLKDWRRAATRYDRCAHTFFLRRLHRCRRDILPQSMSPELRYHLCGQREASLAQAWQ